MGLETPVSSRGDGNIVATIVARKFFIFSKNPQSPREGTETDLYHDLVQQLHVEHQLETLIHLERVRKHYTLSRDDGCKFVRNPSHLGRGRKRRSSTDKLYIIQIRTPFASRGYGNELTLAYPIFGRVTKYGTPVISLIATAVVVFLIFLIQLTSANAYTYIVAASGLTGFIAWLGIALSHYRFRRAYIAQGKDLNDLKYRAKWFPVGPIIALVLCIIVIIGQDTELITKGVVNWSGMLTTYMGVPIFLFFYLYHKIRYKTKMIPLDKVDLSQDVDTK